MQRTKSPYPLTYKPRGGHLSFPPSSCPFLHKAIVTDGISWMDNGLCNIPTGPCASTKCARYKQYHSTKEYYTEACRLGLLPTEKVSAPLLDS